jgi:acyl-CoA thioesterase
MATESGHPSRRMLAADVASNALGIELVDVGPGSATATMTVTPAMVNGHGMAHGGYLFLLADTAFACATNSYGPMAVASGAEVSFVSPASEGDALVAVATERTRYGRNGIYDVTVYRETPQGRDVVLEYRGRSRTVER